jgi:hypothetical protein
VTRWTTSGACYRLGHLKHIHLLAAENRLQLVIGDDFALILRILEFVLLDVRPNPIRKHRDSRAVRVSAGHSEIQSPA